MPKPLPHDQAVSPAFKYHPEDKKFADWLQLGNTTPAAAVDNLKTCAPLLSDYGYWFFAGVLWNAYSTFPEVEVATWREILGSDRRLRNVSIMRPDELRVFRAMPRELTAWRVSDVAGFPGYIVDDIDAEQMARAAGISKIVKYILKSDGIIALFARRHVIEVVTFQTPRYGEEADIVVSQPK